MSNRLKKRRARAEAARIRRQNETPCPNCGQPGAHFVPPSFGEPGFFICDDPVPTRQPATFPLNSPPELQGGIR